jgi:hypothetical protein
MSSETLESFLHLFFYLRRRTLTHVVILTSHSFDDASLTSSASGCGFTAYVWLAFTAATLRRRRLI